MENNKTQTAVEWLENQLGVVERNLVNKTFLDIKSKTLAGNILREIFEQAKEMEREQICDAYIMGSYDMADKEFNPNKYYEETFKSE